MAAGFVWEPASAEETTYYDKLFKAADRDKSRTLDGQETVKFLSFSGLTKAQLKVPSPLCRRYLLSVTDE